MKKIQDSKLTRDSSALKATRGRPFNTQETRNLSQESSTNSSLIAVYAAHLGVYLAHLGVHPGYMAYPKAYADANSKQDSSRTDILKGSDSSEALQSVHLNTYENFTAKDGGDGY